MGPPLLPKTEQFAVSRSLGTRPGRAQPTQHHAVTFGHERATPPGGASSKSHADVNRREPEDGGRTPVQEEHVRKRSTSPRTQGRLTGGVGR